MALDEHRPHIVLLLNLVFGQQRRIEPARQRDARRLHHFLGVETGDQIVVIDLPDPPPMLPCPLGEAVVERQGHDIETDVGRALHVVMAAKDVGAGARLADVAGRQQQDAARADVGGAHRVLGLPHAPDQRRWLLRGKHLRYALELLAGHATDAFDLLRRPFVNFLTCLFEAIDTLLDEFLVFPAVLENVPQHSHQHRNIGSGPDADIVGGMGRGTGQARVDHNEIGVVELLGFKQMLQRYRMRLGRVGTHDHHSLGITNVVEAVGHSTVAPGVSYAGDGGRMTDARLVIGIVGAPERAELAEQISAFVGEFCRSEPIDGIRARLLADLHQLVTNLIDSLIPFDAGPLAIDELQRIS